MSNDHSTPRAVRHGTKLFTVIKFSVCQGTILQLARSDMGQNFSLSLKFMYVKGPFYSLRSPTWDETFHCQYIFCMSRYHSTARAVRHGAKLFTVIKFPGGQGTILQFCAVRHGTKLLTVIKFSVCQGTLFTVIKFSVGQGTILQFAQSDMGRNFSLSFNFLYVKGPF